MKAALFDMTDALCRRYAALEPFYLRRQKFWDVVSLLADLKAQAARENGETNDGASVSRDGVQVIRRYASDDSIF